MIGVITKLLSRMGLARSLYYNLLTLPGVGSAFGVFQRHYATIFMLHRFYDPQRGVVGCDPGELTKSLEYLRKQRYEFLSLAEIFDRLAGKGPDLRGSLAFTMDDGYADQAEVAGPIFSRYDCPVTTFVTTGFLDGQLWFWWDKIEYVFSRTTRRSIQVSLVDTPTVYAWNDETERQRSQADFTLRCKNVSEEEKNLAIIALAEKAEVQLPAAVPLAYAPMTWEQARACEQGGMRFGPHTVTHPILSQTQALQSGIEIAESWKRVSGEVKYPVPIFCYPNGQWQDFSSRETAVLQQLGLRGAVVGEPGFADRARFNKDWEGPFRVRRLAFPENFPILVQYVSGIERCKQLLRGEA